MYFIIAKQPQKNLQLIRLFLFIRQYDIQYDIILYKANIFHQRNTGFVKGGNGVMFKKIIGIILVVIGASFDDGALFFYIILFIRGARWNCLQ